MYDVLLISPHYGYENNGTTLPQSNIAAQQDMSFIVPLGIVHIAQYLHNKGLNVRVVHIPHEKFFMDRANSGNYRTGGGERKPILLEDILKKYPARVCGIQAHWYLYSGGAVQTASLYKKIFPESKVFLGGFTATACWKEFLSLCPDIDGIVLGEGEKPFNEIVEKVLSSKTSDLKNISGTAGRNGSDGFFCNTPDEKNNISIEEIPILRPNDPPFENIFWGQYFFINVARGLCPEECSYCVANNPFINTRPYETLRMDKILEQLHVYQKFGFREVFMGESHFLNMPFMNSMLESIIKENYDMYFRLETHPVIFEERSFIEKLIAAKFLRFTIGCESGSDSLLKSIGRNSTAKQIIGSVKNIADLGGIALTSWICNLPGETEKQFQETQAVMKEVVHNGGFIYWIENLLALPGTDMYKEPHQYGLQLLFNTLDKWMEWALLSKQYVDIEMMEENPLTYLTHLDKAIPPEEMVSRLYSNRELCKNMIPEMKEHIEKKFSGLPSFLSEREIKVMEWYETKGWKLLLF
jgi:radical SAM superfamily enzyme YgiQ (UPF0313 family)